MTDWLATAAFAASYTARSANTLRWIQASAALLWISYGIAAGAAPVVVANLVVAGMAVFSAWRNRRATG
jgi:hypothetical protein